MTTIVGHPTPDPLTLDELNTRVEKVIDVDELNTRVEKVIDVLSDHLPDKWIDDLKERHDGLVKSEDEHGLDENETALVFAFWHAARAVIRDLIVHGDDVRLTRTEISY